MRVIGNDHYYSENQKADNSLDENNCTCMTDRSHTHEMVLTMIQYHQDMEKIKVRKN